jgi:Domain of unknown function (DU1801)
LSKRELDGFIDEFTPEVASAARQAFSKMRKRFPKATVLVYDNTYALVMGFGPSEKASEAVFSLAVYPRWVNLFFLQGAAMPDPNRRLQGSGKQVRHVRLDPVSVLDDPQIRELVETAAEDSGLDQGTAKIVIRMIAKKKRPRRPVKT